MVMTRVCRVGSPPLTRGKLEGVADTGFTWGLIPAHAGKTQRSRSSSVHFGAHPRSRGENGTQRAPFRARSGSSPLTRGKPPVGAGGHDRSGLIPAHAGKTRSRASWALPIWAHPRSRGENSTPFAASCAVMGSSPLTRGKPLIKRAPLPLIGLIPAHAGKTRR